MQSAYRLLPHFVLLWVALACMGSCAGEPDAVTYPTLTGRYADEANLQPLLGDQAYISESEFFIRFKRAKKSSMMEATGKLVSSYLSQESQNPPDHTSCRSSASNLNAGWNQHRHADHTDIRRSCLN